jgi:hypothetical protein
MSCTPACWRVQVCPRVCTRALAHCVCAACARVRPPFHPPPPLPPPIASPPPPIPHVPPPTPYATPRAGSPERAVEVVTAPATYRMWPALGSLHQLMVALSTAKNLQGVLDTLGSLKARQDVKPTAETYHIAIR